MTQANTTQAPVSKAAAIEAKLANARALVAKYESELAGLTKYKDLTKGQPISIEYGRGENKKELSGTVLGTSVGGNGVAMVGVLVGEGIDAQVFRVPVSTITKYEGVAEAQPEQAAPADVVVLVDPAAPSGDLNVDDILNPSTDSGV